MTDHPLYPGQTDETNFQDVGQTSLLNDQPTQEPQANIVAEQETYIPRPSEADIPPVHEPLRPQTPVQESPAQPFTQSFEKPLTQAFPQPFAPQAAVQPPFTPPPYPTQMPRATVTVPPTQPNFAPPPAPKKPKKESKSKGVAWKLALFGLCIALLGSAIGGLVVGLVLKPSETEPPTNDTVMQDTPTDATAPKESPSAQETPTQTQKPTSTSTPPANLSALYEAAVPTIVGIKNEYTTYNYFYQASTASSTGTGFIISPDGEILTNYHVIENAEILTVTLYDGKEYTAELLGYEAESDVALIKIDATDLPCVTLGDSDALMVGEQITAIGNPLGELTYTMTVGYVSAKSRAVYTDEYPINMMQIDAAINPGNSGGPLFNLAGEVVGITTAKYSGTLDGSATIEGIGFAIPINDALAIVDDLRDYGEVQNRAYMGVKVTNSIAGGDIPAGALVQSIERDSAGDKAGLRPSDIITAVDGYAVSDIDTLYQALRPYRGGDTATLTVFRSGDILELTITFGTAETEEVPEETEPATEAATDSYDFPWGGFFP